METKYVRVPFEVELAKKITEKSVDGKIVTRDGRSARVICWDRKCDEYPIIALIDNVERGEGFGFFTTDGVTTYHHQTLDLMLEIPEYMTFNDGDVIAYDNVKDVFFIIGSKCSMTDENPHYYVKYEKGYLTFGTEYSFCRLKGSRLATEEERQRIIDALKESKEPRAKECLKMLGIEEKTECEFNPKDWILIRDNYEDMWCLDIYSHKVWDKDEECYHYYCVGGWSYQCIPYNEQTAHLLGTTENYE